ncbi:MAG: TetR/AcrR family transcriptional regulator [Candidatus Margulisbacteria bacterium]|jgi:AcrR family transcriptional regulator|nr:TetR/AcrR family transcriptional regulator [Candidatus Margulisiibacteriota bacterium]
MAETKRQLKKAATRARIINTARQIYAERGFNTPTSAIARAAGVSHGALFAHFPTRELLILTLLGEFLEEAGGRLSVLSGRGGLTAFLNAHIKFLLEREDFYRRLITETVLLPAEASRALDAIQSTIAAPFLAILERRRGALKPLPPRLIFNSWLGLVHYYLQNKNLFAPEGSALARYGAELARAFRTMLAR